MNTSIKNENNPALKPIRAALRDISNEDYHNGALRDTLGHSKALMMRGATVARVAWMLDHPEDKTSKALTFGSAMHDMLERIDYTAPAYDLPDGYAVLPPDINLRTKEGRAYRDDLIERGVSILAQDEADTVKAMVESIVSNPTIQNLFKLDHIREATFSTEMDGLTVKIRPDMLCLAPAGSRLICVDWKSAEAASPEEFPRRAYQYGYHLEAYFYTQVLHDLTKLPCDFIFAVCEKSAPYEIALYRASEAFITAGEDLWRGELLPKWYQYFAGDYEGLYDPANPILDLDPPAWAG